MQGSFPKLRFSGTLRPSQIEVSQIVRAQLKAGERRFHVVAPPGSGKTVTGLHLWAEVVRKPTLVLAPNSAIQSQWAARTDLFRTAKGGPSTVHVSTDPKQPAWLTSLTYQSVTLPSRNDASLEQLALDHWINRLIEQEQAETPAEAQIWIEDLRARNLEYYHQRLSFYTKHMRDDMAIGGSALDVLHASALQTLQRLRDVGLGMVILDECHHLLGHWGRVLASANEYLQDPIVVGLTATPPEKAKKETEDAKRYREYFGPVDFEVPVPAVVKDGFLAPYQDLAYFVRPTSEELLFIAQTSDRLDALIEELCQPSTSDQPPRESLPAYLQRVLSTRSLPTGTMENWDDFVLRAPAFSSYARLFLHERGIALPPGVPKVDADELSSAKFEEPMQKLGPILSWYIRHGLRRSSDEANHRLADKTATQLRLLGVQITEVGTQVCASPVSRVLAYSKAKAQALIPILNREFETMGDRLRAVVVCDYEKTSAVTGEIRHLLDEEVGGAIAAFRELLTDPTTDALNPVLITGSTVLVDDDLKPKLEIAARQWLSDNKKSVDFSWTEGTGFFMLQGKGADWCPRVYIEMITELFQQGITRCLVGTRGLLGEGWDANKINVLIDLTSVTTSMSVNQLRGRSFRLDPDMPDKLANNWDVVCLAPEFQKGLDDYHRFRRKHKKLYGVTDDGAIEKGVGHVHAAFTDLKPEGIEENMTLLNEDMLHRVEQRPHFYSLWKIGQPYQPEPIKAVERKGGGLGRQFPPFARSTQWTDGTLSQAVGKAVLGAMVQADLIPAKSLRAISKHLRVAERAGGYVRIFLEKTDEETSRLFADAVADVFGPVKDARYVIERSVDIKFQFSPLTGAPLMRILPKFMSTYLENATMRTKRRRELARVHALPRIFARNKKLALVFQGQWNRFVSPGEIRYNRSEETTSFLNDAKERGLLPAEIIRNKEVFM